MTGVSRNRARPCAILFVVCVALWMAGCSSLTARVAGWYITREINSYLDFDSEERTWLRSEVDAMLDAARREDIPRWLNLVRRVRDVVDDRATDENLRALQGRWDGLMDDAVDKLVPKLGQALAKLNETQIDHFEERMRETLDETYEEQSLPADERREEMDDKLIDELEGLIGDVRDEQERTILLAIHTLPDERPTQYRVGKQRIQAGAAFLRSHPDPAAIESELRRLWRTRYDVLGPGRGKQARRTEQRGILLVIDATLSREQRDHAVEELNNGIRKIARFVLPKSAP